MSPTKVLVFVAGIALSIGGAVRGSNANLIRARLRQRPRGRSGTRPSASVRHGRGGHLRRDVHHRLTARVNNRPELRPATRSSVQRQLPLQGSPHQGPRTHYDRLQHAGHLLRFWVPSGGGTRPFTFRSSATSASTRGHRSFLVGSTLVHSRLVQRLLVRWATSIVPSCVKLTCLDDYFALCPRLSLASCPSCSQSYSQVIIRLRLERFRIACASRRASPRANTDFNSSARRLRPQRSGRWNSGRRLGRFQLLQHQLAAPPPATPAERCRLPSTRRAATPASPLT